MSRTIMVISAALDGRLIKAVEAANKLGYKTVACVRREDDVSIVDADRCYAVDGEETEELLEIARREHIDGVLGLWDRSVLSAAVIARELGLPGNSPECVNCLLGKGSFRQLQKDVGVFCPGFVVTDTRDGLEEKCAELHFPVIIKPDQCSSSFGQTVLYDESELIPAFEKAAAYSGNGVVCVEEFVEQEDPLRVLEADVFLLGEDIIWDGTHWNDRFPEAPLRPITDTFPADLDSRQEEEFKSAVRTMLSASGASIGEFNIEGFFTKDGRFFIIEINPRPAGYYSQQDILMFCGVDLSRLLVTTAAGDLSYYEELKTFQRQRNNIFMYPIFSFRSGVFDHVHFDSSIKDALLIFRPFPGGEPGAYIEDIHADNRPVGVAVFGFSTKEELERARQNIRELVYPVLKDDPVCIPVRDWPEAKEEIAVWFHKRWNIPLEAYRESIKECLEKETGVPQWYVVVRDGRIIAGCGVIENDFHERTDLTPNVCAVYVDEEYRNQGIAGLMLQYVCDDMAAMGFETLYLLTDHTGFYERYGWEFLCMVRSNEGEMSRMYVHQLYFYERKDKIWKNM